MTTTSDVTTDLPCAWPPGPVDAEPVALLQYIFGSTTAPKGVALTHRNLTSNSELLFPFFGHSEESRGVSWLPLSYDMSLIGGIIQPLYGKFPVMLMTPADFIRRPLSWLQEISRIRAAASGGPDFAHELCVRKTTAAQRAQRDLSSWRVASNGSELIRAETIENLTRAFESAGFSHEAFHPCYGLAEATLIVTYGLPCVAPSYRRRPAGTRRTFSVRRAGTSAGAFLRTGDLGFVLGRAAAFSLASGDQERLMIAHEITRQAGDVDAGEVAGTSRAAVAAEHKVQVPAVVLPDLAVRVITSDVAHAASVADLAIRPDEQITAKAAAETEVPSAASLPDLTVADKAPARLYRWICGSRVPTDAVADAGSFFDAAARRPGERPRWTW
jgi:hypothetical protein